MSLVSTWHRFESMLKNLKKEVNVLALVMKDPRTPSLAKIVGSLTLLYALSPIDLIPDFIPVLGYLDDLILVPFGVWCTYRLVPDEIIQDCRRIVAEQEKKKLPKDWKGLILIIVIWLALAYWGFTLFKDYFV